MTSTVSPMTSEGMQFILENEPELEEKYPGKYVAIWKKQVVAEGNSISEVYRITDEKNIRKPLVTYIPKDGEENFLI